MKVDQLVREVEVLSEVSPSSPNSAAIDAAVDDVLTPDALAFITELQRRFGPHRLRLLRARAERQRHLDSGEWPEFNLATRWIRDADWQVGDVPKDLQDRRVEITGPTDRKMMINALNSGAKVFMADFEDSLSPTWENVVLGQRNLRDAVRGTLSYESPDGRQYRVNDTPAVLCVRPRGWHLNERHLLVDGEPISASLFDFGLAFFHNARQLLDQGSGPYFYLPKLEDHLEARLWNKVFVAAEEALGLEIGTIKATVLIETVLAAFEMEEILWELRDHAAGLNAGRWDYIFSMIKKFRVHPGFVLPDRVKVTMTVPFMRAYTELLVATCHRRGAHAIGGMAAFIPNRRDPEVTEAALIKVREDKLRESADGFDGTWVAHPDLVPVAMEVFNAALGPRPNQLERLREDVAVSSRELLHVDNPGSGVTEQGLRNNVSVGIRYLESWLRGVGAAAINNLMEDAATAEISRAQIWQWCYHGTTLEDGRTVTPALVRAIIDEELAALRVAMGDAGFRAGRFAEARAIFEQVALEEPLLDFLTLPAYEQLS
ncbi:MAG TPA: malate synthase A [Actinomycetota bacterium]|nr:malate synthase A [Actinomycetota bacterium]